MQYFMLLFGIALAIAGIIQFNKIKRHKDKYYMVIMITLVMAVCLEVFTFNYSSFELVGGDCTKTTYDIDVYGILNQNSPMENVTVSLSEGTDEREYTVTISNIESVVGNLDIIPTTNDEDVKCDIYYKDDAQYSLSKIDSDSLDIVKGVEETNHVKTEFAGELHTLQLKFTVDSNCSITRLKIKQNYTKKISFNIIRVAIVWFVLLMIMTISMTWEKKFDKKSKSRVQKAVVVGFVVIQCLFVTVLTALRYDGSSILLERESMSSMDVYQELTVALSEGKVDLNGLYPDKEEEEQQSIEQLEALDNPYQRYSREGISYKWDRAFYNGKYYCYFGIVPVLLMYLPCYLITGLLLNSVILTWALVILCVTLMSALVYSIAKRWKGRLNFWLVIGAMALFVNCSMILFCIAGSKFYEIACLSALVCVLAGVNLIYTAFTKEKIKKANLVWGALFMALSIGCRPNFLLASFAIAPLICNGLYDYKRVPNNSGNKQIRSRIIDYIKNIFTKEKIKYIIIFAVPYIVIGCGLMFYNYIRFDSVFEFGAGYQLTVYDTSYYSVFDLAKIPIAIYMCFLMMPGFSSQFPFVNTVTPSSNYVGYFYKISSIGLLAYPCMWFLFATPVSIKRGIKEQKKRGFVIACLLTGLVLCYLTTALGGASARYSTDFAWVICIVVIFVIFEFYDMSTKHNIEKGVLTILLLLIAVSVVMNMLLCFSPSFTDINEEHPAIFYGIARAILFWR